MRCELRSRSHFRSISLAASSVIDGSNTARCYSALTGRPTLSRIAQFRPTRKVSPGCLLGSQMLRTHAFAGVDGRPASQGCLRMNGKRERTRHNGGARGMTLALGAVIVSLVACGGNDGSVGIGSGQDPDPVAIDFPIAYSKGPLFDAQMQLFSSTDVRDQLRFNVGTDLYMRDRASPTAVERNITTNETQGVGDVMGAEISVDGTNGNYQPSHIGNSVSARPRSTGNLFEAHQNSRCPAHYR